MFFATDQECSQTDRCKTRSAVIRRGKRDALHRFWLCGAALLALSAPANAQTIDTTPAWNGTSALGYWGMGGSGTFGQTITAPTQSTLTEFSFNLIHNNGGPPHSQYQAFVYRWDGVNGHTTGPALFTSGVMTAPGAMTFTEVAFNTGRITLTPGQQYVLFITTKSVAQGGTAGYSMGEITGGGAYSGGMMVWNNGANFSDLATQTWSSLSSRDFAFKALFAPSTLRPQLLMGTPLNPTNVAGGIDKFLASGAPTGGFLVLTGLAPTQLPGALNQLSGENGTAVQQGGVQLMNLYLSVLTDPAAANRVGVGGGNGGAMGYAPERSAATANLPSTIASAYAMTSKAPPLQANAASRWNVWGSAFGGSNKTSGDAVVVGSHDVRSNAGGFAAGADYRFSPDTRAGFSLAGGSTSWSLAGGLGDGRSDVLLAGVYGTHNFGAAYVSGAASYGNYWTSTSRTVSVAGTDALHADFNAQNFGGRVEGGYRIAIPAAVNVTPYAAVQVQGFRTPSYGETVASGSAQFALNYDAHTATAVRTELGGRIDTAWLATDGSVFNVFGKVAWAHDEVSDPRLNVSFISLPVASFAVNGATPARDLALTTAGAEWRFGNGVSVMAKFDGEFAERSQTYAGTARLRYAW